MEEVFETVQQLMSGFEQGNLPDLGSWNYMLVGFFMLFQGRITAVFGGIAAAAGYFPLVPILLVALLARLIVDLFWYNIGSSGQIDRLSNRFDSFESTDGNRFVFSGSGFGDFSVRLRRCAAMPGTGCELAA